LTHSTPCCPPAAKADTTPDWLKALVARSEALNRKYGLGSSARQQTQAGAPDWKKALDARSDALDKKYKLGKYADK
jgi:hypothetical protein